MNSFDYTLNDDDMRTYVEEADDSTVTCSYSGIGRLTGETRTGTNAFTASYTLDGEGNRTTQTIGANTTSFTLNDDYELTATSGGSKWGHSSFPPENRALIVDQYEAEKKNVPIRSTTDFVYDALGRRYSRTAGGTTTVFYYAGNQALLERQGDTCGAALTLPSPARGCAFMHEAAQSAGEGKGRAAPNVVSSEGMVTNGSEP